MGGRMASHLAAAGVACDGLLFLGYPLHPAGKPDQLRVTHLERIRVPMLFFAGTRDSLCRLDLLEAHVERLRRDHAARITVHVIEGGDHSFVLPKSLRRTAAEVHAEILDTAAEWVRKL
jgi:predicted alpha/beta-hydrolase family hydrolase